MQSSENLMKSSAIQFKPLQWFHGTIQSPNCHQVDGIKMVEKFNWTQSKFHRRATTGAALMVSIGKFRAHDKAWPRRG